MGSRPPQSGGQNQRWPTTGQGGYTTPAAWGVPTASYRGAESEVAHKWARWLHNPCRLGDPHRFRAGGQNQKWPTSGQGGYLTPAQGFFRIIKYQGGGTGSKNPSLPATNPLPPLPPPPFQFYKSSVLWFGTVHTYWGSPLHCGGPNLLSTPLSLLSTLPTVKRGTGGLRLRHFQNFCFFFCYLFFPVS